MLTHWHWDHSFGGAALDVPIIAHRETAAELAHQASLDWSDAALDARVEAGEEIAFCRDMIRIEIPDRCDLDIVLPQIVFDDHLELDLGGVHVTIDHVGGDHAADSCVFHVVEDDLIVLGDCLYQRLYAPEPFLTVASVQALTARIGAYGARLAIEGHDDTLLDGDALARRLSDLSERRRPGRPARRRRARDGARRRRPRDARVPADRPRVAPQRAPSISQRALRAGWLTGPMTGTRVLLLGVPAAARIARARRLRRLLRRLARRRLDRG